MPFDHDISTRPDTGLNPAGGLSRSQQALVDASVEIQARATAFDEIAYQHAVLCQLGLPRKKHPGSEFVRSSGKAWLCVQAGRLDLGRGPVSQALPYGPLPRLALAWVNTYAVRARTRVIPLGDSAASFLRVLGLDDGGRRYRALRTQMHSLAAARIQLGYMGRTLNSQPVSRYDAWLSSSAEQRALWPGEIELSRDYFEMLLEHAVPLDSRALLALRGSALSLDVYTWLAHRLSRIPRSSRQSVFWSNLREQFGGEYRSLRDFKPEFQRALHQVLAVYPSAMSGVERRVGGFTLSWAAPPVPRTSSRSGQPCRLRELSTCNRPPPVRAIAHHSGCELSCDHPPPKSGSCSCSSTGSSQPSDVDNSRPSKISPSVPARGRDQGFDLAESAKARTQRKDLQRRDRAKGESKACGIDEDSQANVVGSEATAIARESNLKSSMSGARRLDSAPVTDSEKLPTKLPGSQRVGGQS